VLQSVTSSRLVYGGHRGPRRCEPALFFQTAVQCDAVVACWNTV